jgi:Spy/CpxP family protein refolding chaperone
MKRIDINLKMLFAVVIVLGFSLSLMAQPHWRGPMMSHRPMMITPVLQYLDLTESQKDQIEQVRLAYLKDVQPIKDEVKINRARINALLKTDDPDMQQIVSLVEANGKLLTQLQVKRIEQKIEVRGLLTDEQKIIFDTHSERMEKWRAMAQHDMCRRTPARNRF